MPVTAGDRPVESFTPPLNVISPMRRRQQRRRRPWGKYVVLAVVLLGLVGLGIWIVPKLRQLLEQDEGPTGQLHTSREYNYSFLVPGKPWKQDDSLRVPLKANLLTMRRTDPNAWLALAAQDYKTRTPRDAEMLDEAVRRLGGYFKNFEWEQQGDVQVGNQRAQWLVFHGDVNDIHMSGQCYVLVHQGIAYWITTWAPAEYADMVAKDFNEIRERFTVLKEREGWTEKRGPTKIFRGGKAGYELRDTEGVWEKWPQAQDADAAADLFLQGKDPVEAKNITRMARVLVLVLEKQNDLDAAVKVARTHLEAHEKKDNPGATIELSADKEGEPGQPGPIGEVRGQLLKLSVKNADGRGRFILLAVVNLKEHVLAIQCECDMKRRSLWERDFSQLLSTLSLRSKAAE
jgi:hypothetical protein